MATSLPTLTDYAGAGGQYAGGVVGIAQGIPGVPTTPLLPAGTNLPITPDGNVVAPPNVGVTPGSAAPPVVPVIAPAAYALGKVRVSQ